MRARIVGPGIEHHRRRLEPSPGRRTVVAKSNDGRREGLTSDERAELVRLRREKRVLEMEAGDAVQARSREPLAVTRRSRSGAPFRSPVLWSGSGITSVPRDHAWDRLTGWKNVVPGRMEGEQMNVRDYPAEVAAINA